MRTNLGFQLTPVRWSRPKPQMAAAAGVGVGKGEHLFIAGER